MAKKENPSEGKPESLLTTAQNDQPYQNKNRSDATKQQM